MNHATEAVEFRLRAIDQRDYRSVAALNNQAYPQGNLTADSIQSCLYGTGQTGRVLECPECGICGFCFFRTTYRKRCKQWEWHLVKVVIDIDHRRHGLGRGLVESLMESARWRPDCDRIWCCVWETHVESLLWLQACGFEAYRVLSKPLEGSDVDAILLERWVL